MPTFERADVFEIGQLGVETTLLTTVSATKKLTATSITNKIMTETQVHRNRGSRFPNVSILNKEWTEASWDSPVATYTEPMYALSGAFGAPDTTTPGGGILTRDHVWAPPTFSGVNPKSYTLENANFVRSGESGGHTVKTIGFDFTRDGVSYSAESFGGIYSDATTPTPGTNEVQTVTITGTPTGGTITLTFYGETTAAIAYNANAAAVLAALEALANIGTGGVSVGGGAGPGTPWTVTFLKQWSSQNVPMMSATNALTGGTSPAVAVTQTTPGAALSELANIPIAGSHWNLYVDSLAAGLGGTKLTRALEVSWSISDLWSPLWVGNTSNPSWVNVVPLPPTTEFRMLLEADAAGMAYLTQLRAGTRIFPRIEATSGDLIEGALNYRTLQDFCVIPTSLDSFGESQGITTVEFSGEITHDPTWTKALNISFRNQQASL